MTSEEPFDDVPPESPLRQFLRVGGTAVLVAAAFLILFARQRPAPTNGLGPGEAPPEIVAAGWLNGPAPTAESLRGRVVVVEQWATWCGPCRARTPHLVATAEKFRGREVTFLGLTDEDSSKLNDIREFVRQTGVPWPTGYGAGETLDRFGAQGIPAIWVIGRDGRIVWNEDQPGELETAIEKALAVR